MSLIAAHSRHQNKSLNGQMVQTRVTPASVSHHPCQVLHSTFRSGKEAKDPMQAGRGQAREWARQAEWPQVSVRHRGEHKTQRPCNNWSATTPMQGHPAGRVLFPNLFLVSPV